MKRQNGWLSSALVVLLIGASGCAPNGVEVRFEPSQASVQFSRTQAKESATPIEIFRVNQHQKGDVESNLSSVCSTELIKSNDTRFSAFALGVTEVLTFVVAKVVEWIWAEIDRKIAEEIRLHTALIEASSQERIYDRSRPGDPNLGIRCFQVSRLVDENEMRDVPQALKLEKRKNQVVALDLVGIMKVDGPTLLIAPLRLYHAIPAAKDSSGQIGLVARMKVDSRWMDLNRGYSENIFDSEILSEKIPTRSGSSFYKQYFEVKKDCGSGMTAFDGGANTTVCVSNQIVTQVALPPWVNGTGDAGGQPLHYVNFKIVESGSPPWLLPYIQQFFASKRSSFTDQILKASGLAAQSQ